MNKGLWCINLSKLLIQLNLKGNGQIFQAPVEINNDISVVFCDLKNNLWIVNEPGIIKIANFKNAVIFV
ncbi:MAG: hypothetical protein C4329_00915 [Chitinophagaceae bacterium]